MSTEPREGAASSASPNPFIGTWHLVSSTARRDNGETRHMDRQGLLIYTADSHMSATVWEANRPHFAENDQYLGTPEECADAVRNYVQYCGTYQVDADTSTVRHHVHQSIFPNFNGSVHTRYFEFDDDQNRRTLTTQPLQRGGVTVVGTLVWRRHDPSGESGCS